jgi:hypothetical protein
MNRILELLATGKYDTDKAGYADHYWQIMEPWLDKPVALLELGVNRGGSFLLWQDLLPVATVVGLDLQIPDLGARQARPGAAALYAGNQTDGRLLQRITREQAPVGWDIVIDDCAHERLPAEMSFHALFKHVKAGGYYCVEDWGTGYWSQGDGRDYDWGFSGGAGHEAGMVGWVKTFVDEVGIADITAMNRDAGLRNPMRTSDFASVTYYHGLVVIKKKG